MKKYRSTMSLHYGKKGVKWGIIYNFSVKIIMIFAAKTVLYEDYYIGKIKLYNKFT